MCKWIISRGCKFNTIAEYKRKIIYCIVELSKTMIDCLYIDNIEKKCMHHLEITFVSFGRSMNSSQGHCKQLGRIFINIFDIKGKVLHRYYVSKSVNWMTFFVEIIKSSRNEIIMRKIMSNVIKNNSYAYKGLNVYFDVFFKVHAFIDLHKVIERGFMESSLVFNCTN